MKCHSGGWKVTHTMDEAKALHQGGLLSLFKYFHKFLSGWKPPPPRNLGDAVQVVAGSGPRALASSGPRALASSDDVSPGSSVVPKSSSSSP